MGLRAQANLTISFGLVNIGISIQKMIEDDDAPKGHLYCDAHKSSLKQQYICASHGEVVDKLGQVTGYEFNGGTVYLDTGEKDACTSEKDKRIELTRYVDVLDIDPIYFEKSYIMWPQKGHEDGYALIQDALQNEDKALVGVCTLNKSTRMMILRWCENTGTLVAHLCNYESNVRRELLAEAQERASKEPNAQAREMVQSILGSLEPDFDPSTVTDEYNDRLRAAIQAKSTGKAPESKIEAALDAHTDFLAALKVQAGSAKKKPAKAKSTASKAKSGPTKKQPKKVGTRG